MVNDNSTLEDVMEKIELKAVKQYAQDGFAYYTILDEVWGYSVGYLKVNLADGTALIYCGSRRNVRFELNGDYASVQNALATFRFEYEAAIQRAHDYGQEVLAAVRAEGMEELTDSNDYGNGDITCIMLVAYSGEYIDKCIDVECTPQEALAMLNSKLVNASCVGTKYTNGRRGFLSWFSYRGRLSIGIGADAKCAPIASCKNADWRWKDRY
jgi:hypothetical protein